MTLAFEDANSKLLDVADVDAEERVDDSLFKIVKLFKLTFSGCCDRRLPYNSHGHSHLNYYIWIYIAQTMCKTRFGSQGVILDDF